MSHIRYVAIDHRHRFLVKPNRGTHVWTRDLSKARLFTSEDAIKQCMESDSTLDGVKKKFKGIWKVECRLVKNKGECS